MDSEFKTKSFPSTYFWSAVFNKQDNEIKIRGKLWKLNTFDLNQMNILDLQTGVKAPGTSSPVYLMRIILHSARKVSSFTRQQCYGAQTKCVAFCFWCKLNSGPEICLRAGCKDLSLVKRKCAFKSTPSTPTAQVCQTLKTKSWATPALAEATKFLNSLKYRTPDILKMLAAKMTLLCFNVIFKTSIFNFCVLHWIK